MISSYVKATVRSAAIAHNRLLFLNQKAKFAVIPDIFTKRSQSIRYYSGKSKDTDSNSTGKIDDVADEFFDEELERDLEFLDFASATQGVGLNNLAVQKAKDVLSWEEIVKKDADPFNLDAKLSPDKNQDPAVAKSNKALAEEDGGEFSEEMKDFDPTKFEDDFIKAGAIESRDELLNEHIKSFELNPEQNDDKDINNVEGFSTPYIPPGMLNYNLPWRTEEEFPDPSTEEFIPNTSPDKFRFDQQGLRACPGKLQRAGRVSSWKNELRCHKIDLDALHYLDVLTLQRFIRNDAEIMNRKETGLCAKCQRRVAKTIKRSRNFGLLPHLGDYTVGDAATDREDGDFHTAVKGSSRVVSKSVLK